MLAGELIVGLLLGFVIAVVTAPVGVSGAVFLLPVQLDLLKVPSPAVTPTNLLFNVVATPGTLLRYRGGCPNERSPCCSGSPPPRWRSSMSSRPFDDDRCRDAAG